VAFFIDAIREAILFGVPPGTHPAFVLVPFRPVIRVLAAEAETPIFPFFQLEGLCHVFVLDEFPCCIVISLPLAFLAFLLGVV
jgi:hypothetical protein